MSSSGAREEAQVWVLLCRWGNDLQKVLLRACHLGRLHSCAELSSMPPQCSCSHPSSSQSCSNTHIEEEINRLRAELLRKDQDADRMQLALAAEKEERERAQVGG